jgi:NADH:ubiquinone oxidoreductase subunit F (NADH-binding)
VHDADAADAVRRAIGERPDARGVRVERTSGRFVAGEARALVRALGGGPALPPGRREHLTDRSILVANAETYAQTAVLLRVGARGFADTGTRAEPGTVLLTIGGAVARPGVVEIPIGTPLGIVLHAAGAGDVGAVVTGGYHGTWLAPSPDVPLSRTGLQAAGGTLGAGVLLVIDSATCALGELIRVVDWLAAQSAAQCGPCRFGLPALADDIRALARGVPSGLDDAVRHAGTVTGRGACAHPDGTARFVHSALQTLRAEIWAHRSGGCGRPVLGRLPVRTR